jgi:hypothetical protein
MNQKNSDLSSKIKENSIDSLQNLTIHGIPNLFREKPKTIKLFWFILTAISACLSVYFIYKTIYDFLEYEVTTEVRLIDAQSLDIPNIMICNKNQLSSSESVKYLNLIAKQIGLKDYDNNKEKMKLFLSLLSPGYILYNISFDLGRNLTLKPNQMIFECLFNNEKCDYDWFEWIFNINYGNCYRINPYKMKKQYLQNKTKRDLSQSKKANPVYGLFMKLYLGQISELNYLMPDKIIQLSIHEEKDNPFDELDLIDLPGGFESTIQIQLSKFSKYPKPYSNCMFDDMNDQDSNTKHIRETNKYYQRILRSNYKYSQSICVEFCKNDYFNQNGICKMAKSSIYIQDNLPLQHCTFNITNQNEFIDQFISEVDLVKEIIAKCLEECPLECEKLKYDTKVLLKQYPMVDVEMAREKLIKSNLLINDSYIDKDLVTVSLYFGSMSYLNYKENPLVTVYKVVSDIGGVLGLFLGK